MAEEPKEVGAGLEKIFMNRIVKQIKESNTENTMTLAEKIETAMEGISNLNVADTNKLTMATKMQGSMVKESIDDFINESGIANLTKNIDILESDISDMKSTLEKNGQDTNISAIKELEEQKRQLEEIRQYGKTLSGFERNVIKVFGGGFEELKRSVQEGGNLTVAGIATSFKDNLRGDFDRVLSFFGPAVGILQQIPFLGTILTFIGQSMKSVLIRLAMAAKDRIFGKKTDKKRLSIDETNLKINQRNVKLQEQQLRTQNKAAISGQTVLGGGDDQPVEAEGDDAKGGGSFRAASIFLGTAAAIGGVAGAGLSAAAAGMSIFAKGALRFAAALAVGGLALGVGFTGVFGAFALGEKMGAFDGMEAFGKVNMLKVLGSMLGLATLMGVLGSIVTSGIGALIMGAGALAIMALVGTLVLMGKGLGEFAEGILPFEKMNIPRIKTNIQDMATVAPEIKELMDAGSGSFFSFGDHPLKKLADALRPYEGDMGNAAGNLKELKGALTNFELPKTTLGEALRDFFGVGAIDQLNRLGEIEIKDGLGVEMSSLGNGVSVLSKALNNLDSTKVGHLKELSNALGRMNKVELNFGTVGIQSPTFTSENGDMTGQTVINNVVSNPISQNNTTIRQSYMATGSKAVPSHIHYNSMK